MTASPEETVEAPPRIPPPSLLLLLLEGRAAGELATTLALRPLLRRLAPGDGHPVMLLPGFLASDVSTRPLRRFLRDLGYWAHRWKLGRNLGIRGDFEQRMADRLAELHAQHGRKVSLIGWSLGGVYARVLASRFPERVRCVITMGAPFAADTKANNSWRLYEWLTDARLDELPSSRIDEFRRTPPVPTTSIFSKSDGVTAWRTSIQVEGERSESIQVPGSHLGLGFNPLVLYAIADRLEQAEEAWQPFFRHGRKHPPGLRRPPEAMPIDGGDAVALSQLSGLDAGFLALETKKAPMLVGGLSILDPTTAGGRLDVEAFRTVLRERLHRALAFRRRLASVPFDLARPYWSELGSDAVDLGVHVERTALPAPGGWRELSALLAWELAQPLDRSRPLWKITFVEDLHLPDHPAGAVALVATVHHAAIDGVSGAEILGALFDGDPEAGTATAAAREEAGGQAAEDGRGLAPPLRPEGAAGGAPSALELLAQGGRDLATTPLTASRAAGRSLLGLAAGAWSRLRSDETPPLPFSAPRCVLNKRLSGRLSWASASFPLERVKAVKTAAGASVNDVVLAVCAGALRGWLADQGELPKESLVAMVPVSVRADDERHRGGNLVSAMLVPLATDEPDPLARISRIRDAARGSKAAHQAVGARTLLESTELLPFALAGLGAQLYSRLHLAERHRPVFNVVVTNVPGPPRRLSIAGAELLAHYGAAPLFDGLGLILTVMSYAGTVTVGVTADHAAMADAGAFAARLGSALDELAAATS